MAQSSIGSIPLADHGGTSPIMRALHTRNAGLEVELRSAREDMDKMQSAMTVLAATCTTRIKALEDELTALRIHLHLVVAETDQIKISSQAREDSLHIQQAQLQAHLDSVIAERDQAVARFHILNNSIEASLARNVIQQDRFGDMVEPIKPSSHAQSSLDQAQEGEVASVRNRQNATIGIHSNLNPEHVDLELDRTADYETNPKQQTETLAFPLHASNVARSDKIQVGNDDAKLSSMAQMEHPSTRSDQTSVHNLHLEEKAEPSVKSELAPNQDYGNPQRHFAKHSNHGFMSIKRTRRTNAGFNQILPDGSTVYIEASHSPRPIDEIRHRQLAGQATFIEDMDTAEEASFWQKIARMWPGQSPIVWKSYYYQNIRPNHLNHMAAIMASRDTNAGAEDISKLNPELTAGESKGALEGNKTDANYHNQEGSDQEDLLIDFGVSQSSGSSSSDDDFDLATKDDMASEGLERTDQDLFNIVPGHTSAVGTDVTCADNVKRSYDGLARTDSAKVTEINLTGTSELHDLDPMENGMKGLTPKVGRANDAAMYNVPIFNAHEESDSIHPKRPALAYPAHSMEPLSMNMVIISNIPVDATLSDVLERVCNGQLVNAKLCDTEKLQTIPRMRGRTAIVIFTCSQEAKEYVDFRRDHPLVLYDEDKFCKTICAVTLAPTATNPLRLYGDFQRQYPFRGGRLKMMESNRATRRLYVLFGINCVEVLTADQVIQQVILFDRPAQIRRFGTAIQDPLVFFDGDMRSIMVEFPAIRDAVNAMHLLGSNRITSAPGVSKGYYPDSCQRTFAELLEHEKQQEWAFTAGNDLY